MDTPPLPAVSLPQLTAALEASWDADTAYLGAFRPGNPALGQCYPTSRVAQWFFPQLEIACGAVDTGAALEAHFWTVDPTTTPARHIDLTWRQFPEGAKVAHFKLLSRHALNDSPPTVRRCHLLLRRVLLRLGQPDARDAAGSIG